MFYHPLSFQSGLRFVSILFIVIAYLLKLVSFVKIRVSDLYAITRPAAELLGMFVA